MKIVKSERIQLKTPVPVYDLTSPKHHNFVLGCGSVVHNSAKKARNSDFQEVLPLKGKIENVFSAGSSMSDEAISLLLSIGYDISAAEPEKNIRVGRIILLTDGDVDGSHIQALILGNLVAYCPQLIEEGRVFMCMPYEYMVEYKGKWVFALDKQELAEKVPASYLNSAMHIKGWGEVNYDVLAEMAFNPDIRRLRRVTCDDVAKVRGDVKALMAKDATARKALLGVK